MLFYVLRITHINRAAGIGMAGLTVSSNGEPISAAVQEARPMQFESAPPCQPPTFRISVFRPFVFLCGGSSVVVCCEAVEMADEVAVDPKVDFVAGTAAGVASLLVGHPFDTSA